MSRSVLAIAASVALAAGCDTARRPAREIGPGAARAPFVIGNRTSHAIAELHVSAVAEQSWEPNLLEAPLPPGTEAIAARLPCSHYDLLVVRGDGSRCVLPNTSMCFAGEPWLIHDVTLEACLWRR